MLKTISRFIPLRKPMLAATALFLAFSSSCTRLKAQEMPDSFLRQIPSKAEAVFLVDFRSDNPSMKVMTAGQQEYTWEVLKAWSMTAGHALLTMVDKQLRLQEDLLDWLDGRFAVVLLASPEGQVQPKVLFLARVKEDAAAREKVKTITEAATKKAGTKSFTKDYNGVEVAHVINSDPKIDFCYTLGNESFVATDSMDNLKAWIDGGKEDPGFRDTAGAKELDRYSEGIVRFYVKPSALAGIERAVPVMPPMIPGGAATTIQKNLKAPSPSSQPKRAPAPPTPGASPSVQSHEEPLPVQDVGCVVGSLTYRDNGVLLRVSAVVEPKSDKVRDVMSRLSEVRELYAGSLGFCPDRPLAVAAIPDLRSWAQLADKDIQDADLWGPLLGLEPEAVKGKVPSSVSKLLEGDVVFCLPELQATAPKGGKPVGIAEVNPLDFVPFVVGIRAPDDCDWPKAMAELKAFFHETLKVEFQEEDGTTAVQPTPEEGSTEKPKPLSYFAQEGNHLLISPSREQLSRAIKRLREGGDDIEGNPDFAEVSSAAFQGSLAKFYFDPVKFLATGGEVALTAADMPNPYVRHAVELSLDGLRGIGLGARVKDNVVEGTYFIGMDYDKLSRLSSFYAMTVPVTAAMTFPVFARARGKAQATSCLSNLRHMALGALMYAQDHGGTLPDCNRWKEQLLPYVKNEAVFRCPEDSDPHPTSYAMNAKLHLMKESNIGNPIEVVLFFDAIGKSPSPHGSSAIVAGRHEGGANACYVDGHSKWAIKLPESAFMPKQ